MGSRQVLAGLATRLNRAAGAVAIPALFFFTDPERTPDPLALAALLPRGTALVYRHFGAPDCAGIARRLAAICRGRGLLLLIAGDPTLAARVRADGVHWPERLLPQQREPGGLTTAAAHSAGAVSRAAAFGADACILGPVFSTNSASGRKPLGLFHASQLARSATIPVIALGGVNAASAKHLCGRGFAGLAAVEALAEI